MGVVDSEDEDEDETEVKKKEILMGITEKLPELKELTVKT